MPQVILSLACVASFSVQRRTFYRILTAQKLGRNKKKNRRSKRYWGEFPRSRHHLPSPTTLAEVKVKKQSLFLQSTTLTAKRKHT